jgi:hypothetical protein
MDIEEHAIVNKTLFDYIENITDYILRRLHEGPTIAILAALLMHFGFSASFDQAMVTAGAVVAILPNHIELTPVSEWFTKKIKKHHNKT